ncbi:unnamed protein product [Urochloa humidicola]
MGKKGTRRRNKKKPSRSQEKDNPPAGQTSVHDLPDDLLDRVLLHLAPSSLHLVRAAATCRRWRHVVAGGSFLARCRALHGAPRAVGHYYVTDAMALYPADHRRRVSAALTWVMFVPTAPAMRAKERKLFSLNFMYRSLKVKEGHVVARKSNYQWLSRTLQVQGHRNMEIVDSRGSLLLL